jgi:hypothetical protein
MKRALAPLLVAFAFCGACDDDFVKGWLVDRTRVLGARVEASSDSARATVAPGEAAKVTWVIGAPKGTGRLDWAFAVCASPIGVFPEPRCDGPALVSGSGVSDGEVVPMELVVPPAEAIGETKELLILAAFCEGGTPALDARKFEATCAAGGKPLLASAKIRLTSDGANRNPEIAPGTVLLDGAPMPISAARASAPCAGGDSPVVVAGSAHGFGFRFRPEDREPDPATGTTETLIASHVTTSGKLERQYSALEPNEAAPKDVAIPWTAPPKEEAGPEGRLVELFFILRDGRGGLAFARRTVCVRAQ